MSNNFLDAKSAYAAYISHLHSTLGITPLEANIMMLQMAFASILFSYNATHQNVENSPILNNIEPVQVNELVLLGATNVISDIITKDLKQVIELQRLVFMNAEGKS